MPQLQALAQNLTQGLGGASSQQGQGAGQGAQMPASAPMSFFAPQSQASASGPYAQQLTAAYQNLLGRAPDAPGMSFYQNALSSGTPPANIPTYFRNSPEYQADQALGLISPLGQYNPNMAATPAQQNLQANFSAAQPNAGLPQGINYGGVGGQLLNQAGANMTNLSQLYGDTLGRAPDASGASYYMNLLHGGTPMSQVSAYIAASPEAATNGMANRPTATPFGMIQMPAQNNPNAGVATLRGTPTQVPLGTNFYPPTGSPSPGTLPSGTPSAPTPTTAPTPAPTSAPAPSPPSFAQQIQNIANLPGASSMLTELGYTPSSLNQLANTGTVSVPTTPSPAAATQQAGMVQNLYQSMLGRAGTPDEVSYYTNLLNSGTPLSTIQQYFANSPEYKAKS